VISLKDALSISTGGDGFNKKNTGILITFDDGLSDHYTAAKILSELNISAIFFIPTCILEEKLPANPIIIHYTIAVFGIEKFLKEFREILVNNKLDKKLFDIQYSKDKDNVLDIISKIKSTFKYKLGYYNSRKILLDIYKNLFSSEYKNMLSTIHLTESQIREMLEMGHYVGTHTYSHISVAATELNSDDFIKEIISPKNYLEQKFNTKVNSFSYPFGGKNDCLSSSELIKKTSEYNLAFTVEEILNTRNTSPYQLGRYQINSSDTSFKLNSIIQNISKKN
jgi:peptidoglycan/xylan/chitin deacetylase (PgdA/CDA1 family)